MVFNPAFVKAIHFLRKLLNTKRVVMFQQVTKGIKISVLTKYQGALLKKNIPSYAFRYTVRIENQGKDVVNSSIVTGNNGIQPPSDVY